MILLIKNTGRLNIMKLEQILSKNAIREFSIIKEYGLHSLSHPLDQEKLRRFICACYSMGKKKKDNIYNLANYLIENHNFEENKAEKFVSKIIFGMEMIDSYKGYHYYVTNRRLREQGLIK
jgi:hypothetical protein